MRQDLTTFVSRPGDIAGDNARGLRGLASSDPIVGGPRHAATSPRYGALKQWANGWRLLSGDAANPTAPVVPPNIRHYSNTGMGGYMPDITKVDDFPLHPVLVEFSLGWDFSHFTDTDVKPPASPPARPTMSHHPHTARRRPAVRLLATALLAATALSGATLHQASAQQPADSEPADPGAAGETRQAAETSAPRLRVVAVGLPSTALFEGAGSNGQFQVRAADPARPLSVISLFEGDSGTANGAAVAGGTPEAAPAADPDGQP